MSYWRSLGCLSVAVDKNIDSANLLESWLNDCSTSVPCLCRPPIAISNRYAAIDDDAETMTVPIGDLIKKSTTAKKLKSRKNILSHGASCSPSSTARPCEPTLFPALPGHDGPSSWTVVGATQNYENFMLQTHGTDVTGIDIEVIKNSSLGVEGWALYDVGEDPDQIIDIGGGVADIMDDENREFHNPSDDDNMNDLFKQLRAFRQAGS